MKKNRNVWYLIKEGIRGLFLHGFMSFAAICVTVACLILIGSFYLVMLNVNAAVDRLDSENQVVAFIDESLNEAEARSVGTKINLIANVSDAQFVTKEEAFDAFVNQSENKEAFFGLPTDTFRHRFVITLDSSGKMAETVEQLKQIDGIADVSAKLTIAEGFSAARKVLSLVSTALIAILLVVSLFIISNTVKLAMYDRKDEIGIMKMVGATNSFIRIPFVIEGFFIGVLSAAIAFFAEWGIYDVVCDEIEKLNTSLVTLISFRESLVLMVLAYTISGLFVGVIGSALSISRFLDV